MKARTPVRVGLMLLASLMIPGCDGGGGATVDVTVIVVGGGTVYPAGGHVVAGSSVTFTAMPATGWTFNRWEGDLTGSTNPQTVVASSDLNITAVFTASGANNSPVAENLSLQTSKNVAMTIVLDASDADGDTLTYTWTTPQHGTLTGTAPNLTYMPDLDYTGSDTFQYYANDGQVDGNTAQVSILVTEGGLNGWARSFGGLDSDAAYAITGDGSGNVFVAGVFLGTFDFDPGPDNDVHTAVGMGDAFLSKFDSQGNFLWAKTFGSTGNDGAVGLACDGAGGVYVVGYFSGTVDFDPGTSTTDTHVASGSTDAFVSKFSSAGAHEWTRTVGGTDQDHATGVSVDPSGNVYMVGAFSVTAGFNASDSADIHTSLGGLDGFVVKYNSTGTYLWSAAFGGSGDDEVLAVHADVYHNVWLAGYFAQTVDFDPGSATNSRTSVGQDDAFVVQLDSGGHYGWAGAIGGSQTDRAQALITDNVGNVYVGGYFSGTVDLDPSSGSDLHTSTGGSVDGFIASFLSVGTFRWGQSFGGAGEDQVLGLGVDPAPNVYAIGFFSQTVDFDPGSSTDTLTSAGGTDIFLTKHAGSGTYSWTDVFGGTGDDYGQAVHGTTLYHVYGAGTFQNLVDFNPDATNRQDHQSLGSDDAFLFNVLGASGEW